MDFKMKTKNTLPFMCYVKTENGETVVIQYGEKGYSKNAWCTNPDGEPRDAEELNKRVGVTEKQADIMKGGSMFGWNTPLVTNYLEGL